MALLARLNPRPGLQRFGVAVTRAAGRIARRPTVKP